MKRAEPPPLQEGVEGLDQVVGLELPELLARSKVAQERWVGLGLNLSDLGGRGDRVQGLPFLLGRTLEVDQAVLPSHVRLSGM